MTTQLSLLISIQAEFSIDISTTDRETSLSRTQVPSSADSYPFRTAMGERGFKHHFCDEEVKDASTC
jgi:hypothetical protein